MSPFFCLSLATLLGAGFTLGFPPFFWWPLSLISAGGLLYLLYHSTSWKNAFAIGWWWGFGHYVSGLYWIANALQVDAEQFAWLTPFALTLIPAAMALYPAMAAMLARQMAHPTKSLLYLGACIAFCMTITELARAFLPPYFPWLSAGVLWTASLPMLQHAAALGTYGLTLLFWLLVALCTYATTQYIAKSYRKSLICVAIILCTTTFAYITGHARIEEAKQTPGQHHIRLVQPSIPQKLKWDPRALQANFLLHLELSYANAQHPTDHSPDAIIWSEAAIPFYLEEDPAARRAMTQGLHSQAHIITGSTIRTQHPLASTQYYNGMQVLNASGTIKGQYAKHQLVPFGEFIPLRNFFPFIQKITPGAVDFSEGPGPQTITLPNLPPFSPLICYESIFSSNVLDRTNPPDWLLNLTNDAWFGNSIGPHQHFHTARMRAVEEGMPLVRVAGGGISAVVDSYGRIQTMLGLHEVGTLNTTLPEKIHEKEGWFALYRKYSIMPALYALLLLGTTLVLFHATWHASNKRTRHHAPQ